jgi:hypothetical protein
MHPLLITPCQSGRKSSDSSRYKDGGDNDHGSRVVISESRPELNISWQTYLPLLVSLTLVKLGASSLWTSNRGHVTHSRQLLRTYLPEVRKTRANGHDMYFGTFGVGPCLPSCYVSQGLPLIDFAKPDLSHLFAWVR